MTLNSQLADSSFAATSEVPSFVGVRPPSPAKSLGARPDLYSYSSYAYTRPKVKLGPRPSLDIGGRPRTSSGTNNYRPVSSIPAGFKLFSKGSRKGGKARTRTAELKRREPKVSFSAFPSRFRTIRRQRARPSSGAY